MLTVEKLSGRPDTFRRLTGADADIFYEISETVRPLRKNAEIILKRGAETATWAVMKIICRQCSFITGVM